MSNAINQDIQYINNIRAKTTALLDIDDKAQALSEMWNTCFGGARLTAESFTCDNDGLTKTDIENGLNVLTSLHSWLDEAGLNRRVNLQKLRVLGIL